jgi:hypothetical protein
MPVSVINCAAPRWLGVPTPGEATLSLRGEAFASSMRSLMPVTGRLEVAANAYGTYVASPMVEKSLSGSYGIFEPSSAGPDTRPPVVARSSV